MTLAVADPITKIAMVFRSSRSKAAEDSTACEANACPEELVVNPPSWRTMARQVGAGSPRSWL